MVQAVADRDSRLGLRLSLAALLALAGVGASPAALFAQGPAAGKGAEKKGDSKADAKAANSDDDGGVVDSKEAKRRDSVEILKDERAEKALTKRPANRPFPSPRLSDAERASMLAMASGLVGPERTVIGRYLDTVASELTSASYINAVISPPPTLKILPRDLEKASQDLVKVILTAKDKKNQAFLSQFSPLLVEKMAPLLQEHLITRIHASIALAYTASPAAVDVAVKQLNDPDQTVWVKDWSARCITNAADGGKINLEVTRATAAAAALVKFLKTDPTAPWPVRVRALEALGSLKQASTTGPQGQPDAHAAALAILADGSTRIEVRCWAAWAIGMMNVPSSTAKFNFGLEAYLIGKLAEDVAARVAAEYDAHPKIFTKTGVSEQARYLTGFLLFQIYPAIAGEPGVSGSGLATSANPSAAAFKPLLTGMDGQIKSLGRASFDLIDAGGTQLVARRAALGARIAEFDKFIEKFKPTDLLLYPGGPKLEAAAEEPAAAPAPAPKTGVAPKPAGGK